MNIHHLRYAVEVERTRSITEAAENLFMGQPNLSRAIRELENELGITVFDRTPKGIIPTEQGEEFLHYARSILAQFDEMSAHYRQAEDAPGLFRLSVARAGYISYTFARFAEKQAADVLLDYKETNALRAIRNLTEDGYDLGIVRYQADYEKYFLATFKEKGLAVYDTWSFRYLALLRADHPAAKKPVISLNDLADSVLISHGDTYIPSQRHQNFEPDTPSKRHIHVYERGSQYDLLSTLPRAYMWVSPMPEVQLKRYDLVLRPCEDHENLHKDVVIFRRQRKLSPLGERFLAELVQVRKEIAQA